MPVVLPFRAVRYDPERVPIHQVVAPPYDVISPTERVELHQRHPANVVRLILGEERPQDNEEQNRYRRAADYWRAWRGQGILKTDSQPTFYVYRQQFPYGSRTLTRLGFLGRMHLEPFGGRVRAHEQTRSAPKEELYRLLAETAANLSPVFALFHDPDGRVREQLEAATRTGTPLYDFADWGQVNHTLWAMSPAACAAVAQAIRPRPAVIADGHHRYESRLRYARWRQEQAGASPAEEWSWEGERLPRPGYWYSLTYLVAIDDPGLLILPTHRLVRVPLAQAASVHPGRAEWPLPGEPGTTVWVRRHLPAAAVAWQELPLMAGELSGTDRTSGPAVPTEIPADAPARHAWFVRRVQNVLRQLATVSGAEPRFAVLDATGRAALVRVTDEQAMAQAAPQMSPAWRQLDVAALHQLLLDRLLAEVQPLGEELLEYTQDAERVATALAERQFSFACLLPATRPEQVEAVAAAGEKMPAKSTFFHPKLLSGLVMDDLQVPIVGLPGDER